MSLPVGVLRLEKGHSLPFICLPKQLRYCPGISPQFKIAFYAGRYDELLLGIVPVGNPMDCIPRAAVDVVVLEEPEHLCWFHCGPQWTSTFKHVVSFPPLTQHQVMQKP